MRRAGDQRLGRVNSSIGRALLVTGLMTMAMSGSALAAGPPKGALSLPPSQIKSAGGATCGDLSGSGAWVPGSILPGGYFLPFSSLSANFGLKAHQLKLREAKVKAKAADARGKKAAALRARAKDLANEQRKALKQSEKYGRRSGHQIARCNAAYPPDSPSSPSSQSPSQTQALRFDLKGASGLALRSSQNSSGPSNLDVLAGGTVRDAVVEGSVTISEFLIAHGGKTYVLFPYPTRLEPEVPESICLLARVDPGTGLPECIDSTLSYVNSNTYGSNNPAVQFDDSGAIYYTGSTNSGKTVLRKYSNGTTTDLINDNISIQDFLVMPGGGVIISGSTQSTGVSWTRFISPNGSLKTLRPTASRFLRLFPDGNAYMGLWGNDDVGVRRFMNSSSEMDPKYWIGNTNDGRQTHHTVEEYCDYYNGDYAARSGFCGSLGITIADSFATSDGKFFALAGYQGDGLTLTQYFPEPAFPDTGIRHIAVGEAAGDDLVLSGTDSSGRNLTTRYDTNTDDVTQLVGTDTELEIYHLSYLSTGNKVLFDGLRFSDNRYVLGEIDLNTNQVTYSTSSAQKWEDVQAFG